MLHKGWLLTVDQGKLVWNYFILLVAAVVLFCHLWDALFGPFLLMSSHNSLACFCRMIAGISTITDCGTLFILTLEAVGKACACVAHAPVCSWWFQLHREERQLWNVSMEQFYEMLWTQRVSTTLLLFDSFLQTLKWSLPSSHCSSCKCPCLHVGKVLVCECKCWGLTMEVPSLMYRVSPISSQIRNSPTSSGDQSHMGNNEWLVGKKQF